MCRDIVVLKKYNFYIFSRTGVNKVVLPESFHNVCHNNEYAARFQVFLRRHNGTIKVIFGPHIVNRLRYDNSIEKQT